MNDRLNRAVERLLLDKRFLRRFRRDPEAALRSFALTDQEIDAVKLGDASRLVRLGLDPNYVWPKVRSPFFPAWILTRAKKLTPAVVVAVFALQASPAFAAPPGQGRRSRVGRISRYFGRQRFGGEFHAQLARTGRSGRLTSRAATRRDTSRFAARARGAAREFGIQPPPGSETP
jgi:hypothetical protein